MPAALTFMASRQNTDSPTIVLWGGVEPGTDHLLVLVARRRLSPEESDAALAGQLPECERLVVPPTADALRDDFSPGGQPRYYAVLSVLSGGARKPLRFRAGPMSQPPESTLDASTLRAPSAAASSTFRVPVAAKMAAATPAAAPQVLQVPAPKPAPPAPDPMEARRAAQRRAQIAALEAAETDVPPARDASPRPSVDFPIERFGLRMVGASQTWDGLRVQWESEGHDADAFEVVIADHALAPDEVGELLTGDAVPGAAVRAVSATTRVVIDNLTPREARGYYAVIARTDAGDRVPVGCVAQGWDECRLAQAPFYAPDAVDEVRDLANGQVREARVQLMLWHEEQDAGAWREALRLVDDALVIYPGFRPALDFKREVEAARRV